MQEYNNILIIDDDTSWQGVLGKLLEGQGYIPHYASVFPTGLEQILKATSWFAGFRIPLCIIDLHLLTQHSYFPEGYALLAVCKLVKIPTIVITGFLVEGLRDALIRQTGTLACFGKATFDGQEFLTIVGNVLSRAGGQYLNTIHDPKADEVILETRLRETLGMIERYYRDASIRINEKYDKQLKILRTRWSDKHDQRWHLDLQKLDEEYKDLISQVLEVTTLEDLVMLLRAIRKTVSVW